MSRRPHFLTVGFLAVASLFSPVVPSARGDKLSEIIYLRTVKSSALIQFIVPEEKAFGFGTGWIISRNSRLMITNHHVVSHKGKIFRKVSVIFPTFLEGKLVSELSFYANKANLSNIRSAVGTILHSDPSRDLALIRLDNMPPDMMALKLASGSPRVGERVHSVGNPGVARPGLWIYTVGNVRQVFRKQCRLDAGQIFDARTILTQSAINQGDSGGPLVNDRGELVGVTSFFNAEGRLISSFVDVSEVIAFWRKAKAASGGSFRER